MTIVSCPGKVLISGGYLLLDRSHIGLVIGTSSRFYTLLFDPRSIPHSRSPTIHFILRSPQFHQAQWSYLLTLDHQSNLIIHSDPSCSHNKFVDLAVRESLRLSLALQTPDRFPLHRPTTSSHPHHQAQPITITAIILGDNDFYSQPRLDNLSIQPFNPLNTTLKEVHKTGLGSSAAMVTSLCSAILLHFTPSIDSKSRSTRILLHNLSQYVHSLAQGKVGSGFDVSAAVWGSHVYRRFSPSCLSGLLDSNDQLPLSIHQLREILDPDLNPTWTNPQTASIVQPFSIPPFTTLILADVDAGSHTPSMVGQVLKWKDRENEIASQIWNELSRKNDELKLAFKILEEASRNDEDGYLSEILKLSNDPNFCCQSNTQPVAASDDTRTLFVKVSSLTKSIRRLMKDMGKKSKVPIEPDGQTDLLDECEKLPGVIGSGVPGAGGYDAIWVLLFTAPSSPTPTPPAPKVQNEAEHSRTIKTLQEFLNNWSGSSVRVLSPDSWVVGGSKKKANGSTQDRIAGENLQLEAVENGGHHPP